MIQAAPLIISFARVVPMLNKLIGAVGITELGNRVNNYIQENPDESANNNSLSFLVRIPREGYSVDVVRRRILQWRRMGLDVSSAEPALFQNSDDDGYEIYKSVEEKVRRAVELDNRLDILMKRGHVSEVTKMRFRVRQLTGLDAIESRIDELI